MQLRLEFEIQFLQVSTVKFLGITLDENLTFNDHVKNVTTKISKSVGVMRLHCQLPTDVMVVILFFGVFPSDLCVTGMGKIGTYECCKG